MNKLLILLSCCVVAGVVCAAVMSPVFANPETAADTTNSTTNVAPATPAPAADAPATEGSGCSGCPGCAAKHAAAEAAAQAEADAGCGGACCPEGETCCPEGETTVGTDGECEGECEGCEGCGETVKTCGGDCEDCEDCDGCEGCTETVKTCDGECDGCEGCAEATVGTDAECEGECGDGCGDGDGDGCGSSNGCGGCGEGETVYVDRAPHEIGNVTCPVMGEAVAEGQGFEYRGWWIGICCKGCGKAFAKHLDDCVAVLLEQTGIDVRLLNVLNSICPVSGDYCDATVGCAYNGYYISFKNEACMKAFLIAPDAFSPTLEEEVGLDVTTRFIGYPADADDDATDTEPETDESSVNPNN